MTSQEMMKATSSKGGWYDRAENGQDPDWIEAYPPESTDPNYETIFGYDAKVFMSRQYK